MTRSYTRWRALPGDERRLLLGLMAALPMIAALVRLLGAVRTTRLLERTSRRRSPRCLADAAQMQAARRLAALAAVAGRRGAITATCLRQALLVHWLLRRRGFAPQLRLGVRKQADAFDAHAWVELQGEALGQPRLAHVPFPGRGLGTTLADRAAQSTVRR